MAYARAGCDPCRVTELGDAEQRDRSPASGSEPDQRSPRLGASLRSSVRFPLLLGALGVVYGDIGTSPLYSVQTVFGIDHGRVRPTESDVYGVVSLIFWSITVIVTIKYIVFVMRADNDGEGGVIALAALARRVFERASAKWAAVAMALGVLGASLFYGDSTITPAISVLSAMEGLEVSDPSLKHVVLPISLAIIVALFLVQRFGTHRVGGVFGPVMVVWFLAIATAGVSEIVRNPRILEGLSPTYAVSFFTRHQVTAFIAMGAIVLAITGAEALYADMGHFGAVPIRVAWFALVFPALTLNYLAQAALIIRTPAARTNPFFELLPHWALLPMVGLATAATVIASQAVISGAFSMTRQALRLGLLPHMTIRQTSAEHEGQVYLPAVNWALFVAVVTVTVGFGHSARLATAYGVAVTGTFLITTTLLLIVARHRWHWSWWQVGLLGVICGGLEVMFFAANLTKVAKGGWLTLLIAAAAFTTMMTWQKGRTLVTARRVELEGQLPDFLADLSRKGVDRVPGMGVFPHPNADTTPLALRANIRHLHVLHETIVIISGRTANVPHIPWERRLTFTPLGDPADRIFHVGAEFGFQDPTDFPAALHRAIAEHLPVALADADDASYFVSRVTLRRTQRAGMAWWRKRLFIGLAHNAASQVEFLHLPADQTIVLSAEVGV
jgi:KUP system potassium uptake protein